MLKTVESRTFPSSFGAHQQATGKLYAMCQTHDEEIDRLKSSVSCAVVLERSSPPWHLDRRTSTAGALKYRRGEGEIIIVNHEQRGWWDAGDPDAKGDVFTLVQHLDPSLNFGQARRYLRSLAGIAPSFPAFEATKPRRPPLPAALLWRIKKAPFPGSPAWRYLTVTRQLPARLVEQACEQDLLREGRDGTAWFAHRDGEDLLTGIEMRGPTFKGFSKGHEKSLFRFRPGYGPARQVVVVESPIDALSYAALHPRREQLLIVATAGGMGPVTLACLDALIASLADLPEGRLRAATDADKVGYRYANMLAAKATTAGVRFIRDLPSSGDWNDDLQRRSRQA